MLIAERAELKKERSESFERAGGGAGREHAEDLRIAALVLLVIGFVGAIVLVGLSRAVSGTQAEGATS